MERFVKGDILVVNFYYSNAIESKRRPAMVLADCGEDVLLVEITTKSRGIDDILIKKVDLQQGTLKEESWLRPLKLGTFHKSEIAYKIGHLKDNKINEIIGVICGFLRK